MNLYYKIWIDGLQKLKSIPANREMWKFYGMTFMSMAMAINFMVVVSIVERNIFQTSFYHLEIAFLSGTMLAPLVNFFIMFFFPCVLINYILIFRNRRYEILFKKYAVNYGGKLYITYLMTSYFSPFFLLLIGYLVSKI